MAGFSPLGAPLPYTIPRPTNTGPIVPGSLGSLATQGLQTAGQSTGTYAPKASVLGAPVPTGPKKAPDGYAVRDDGSIAPTLDTELDQERKLAELRLLKNTATPPFMPPSGGIYPGANASPVAVHSSAPDVEAQAQREHEIQMLELQERLRRERELEIQTREQTERNAQRQAELDAEKRSREYAVADRAQFPAYFDRITGGTGDGSGDSAGAGSNAAADLAFARAKDREGILASRALRDLSGLMTATGRAGGGDERLAQAATLGGAFSNLNDVNTAQAVESARRAWGVEDRNYQGELVRRGQNLGLAPTVLGLVTAGARY